MRFLLRCTFLFFIYLSPSSFAEEPSKVIAPKPIVNAFISDDLFIFMRSGAGEQYRLLGSINAGTPIALIGKDKNGFQKISDEKGRTGWIKKQYIQLTPSLRAVIVDLNAQLASNDENKAQLNSTLLNNKEQINNLSNSNTRLRAKVALLNKNLVNVQSKLKKQDNSVKKQWFYNGAIVLIIGLLLGLILPRLAVRRRNSMDSWQ